MPQFSKENNNGNPFQQGDNDHTAEFDSQDIAANKVICGLSYLGILFFLPLVACPNSAFGRFHANQGLLLFVGDIALVSISRMFGFLPIIGSLISSAIGLLLLVLIIVSMVNAFQGYAREIPGIGHIRLIK